ncbi:hypothetical protein SPRG_12460 [Saprolegnia parasitica CBS 223.65]|uniref:Methyltransferase domain-containing protein n=1 Tax=Saprolegnia parasitica (strain CBS 223.65) TaxID=695850 RepID=A0A067C4K8_SAPPC|nr:hypothetical protein SPRG_12460 [Saprolegnia parasitica CBS 223.65]KDO21496.1 hypothetical protein SPRG_12460 [Saprolegnia parasitica CBS 223.65]|eukprot:XP_012207763.1 hypothetical protein SPRG_12460 [Saprolegnia parasitica CBS 223.65]
MVIEAPSLVYWRTSGLCLLDLREEAEQCYVLTCDRVVPIPWSAQKARCHEYPARQAAFGLLCPRDRSKAQVQVDWFLSETIRVQQLPWRCLAFYIVDSDDTAAEANALGLVGAQTPLFPQPRLWSPNALLFELVPAVVGSKAGPTAAVIDLACGSGRDMVYFAEEVLAVQPDLCNRFIGVNDNRSGRKKGLAFASRRGVGKVVDFIKMDLNRVGPFSQHAWGPIQCVYGCRFLNRRLFAVIRALVPVGGVVGWMHFCAPPDGSPWRWAHPSQISDILKLGELRRRFEDCFEILVDTVVPDTDHGRPMNVFVARKRMHPTKGAFLV